MSGSHIQSFTSSQWLPIIQSKSLKIYLHYNINFFLKTTSSQKSNKIKTKMPTSNRNSNKGTGDLIKKEKTITNIHIIVPFKKKGVTFLLINKHGRKLWLGAHSKKWISFYCGDRSFILLFKYNLANVIAGRWFRFNRISHNITNLTKGWAERHMCDTASNHLHVT